MANYNYGSPSPSPPPPDGHTYQQQDASICDLLLHLRRRANDGPADGHSRHRQQQQVQVISSDPIQLITPIKDAYGTTRLTHVVICNKPRHRDAAYPRHHRQPTTVATPYHRPEHHERWTNWSNRRRRRSPAPHDNDDDDKWATKVVCLANMLSPDDCLEDGGFYQDFLEDVTEEAHKFGDLVKVVIPRPDPVIERGGSACVVAGVGKVFVEFRHLNDAAWCRKRLDGRWYGGKEIAATFFSHDRFAAGDYA